jgi:hypothetical protein
MNSGFFGEENIRDLKITAGILAVIFLTLLSAFITYGLFRSVVLGVFAFSLFATFSAFGIFGPSDRRVACWLFLASISFAGLIVGALVRVESNTYHSFFSAIWNFILGLACVAIVVMLAIGVAKALLDSNSETVDPRDSPDQYSEYKEPNDSDWDDDEDDGLVYKVDEDSVDALIEALNDDTIDPSDIEDLIDNGAKNARISFQYKKPNERARRRKVIVKKVDGECLGCIDLADRSYKNFRFDRISDTRST